MGKKKRDKVKKSDLLKDALTDLDTHFHQELDQRFEEWDKEVGERFDGVGRQVDDQGDKIADLQQTILAHATLMSHMRSQLAGLEERPKVGLKTLDLLRKEIAALKAQEAQNALDIRRLGGTLTLHTQEAEWEKYFPRDGQADSAAALAMVNAFEEKFPQLIKRLRQMDLYADPENQLNKTSPVPSFTLPIPAQHIQHASMKGPDFGPELEALLQEEEGIAQRMHLERATQTRDMLLLIGIDLPIEMLRNRFQHNLNEALAWAAQQHLIASDSGPELARDVLPKPAWLNELEHEMAARRSFEQAKAAGHPSAYEPPRLGLVRNMEPMKVFPVDEASLVDEGPDTFYGEDDSHIPAAGYGADD